MLRRKIFFSSLFLCVILFASQIVFAQSAGSVSGRVTNGSGQGTPSAKVYLIGLTTNNMYQANTNPFGYYSSAVQTPFGGEFYLIYAEKKQHSCNAVVELILSDIENIDLVCTPD